MIHESIHPSKQCTKCKFHLEPSAFHRNQKRKDGLSSWCKYCSNESTAKWASKNRQQKNKTDREWKQRNRHKDRARGAVRRALAKGELVKPLFCGSCGIESTLEAHHVNYEQPLLVLFLCKHCHAQHHAWGKKNV